MATIVKQLKDKGTGQPFVPVTHWDAISNKPNVATQADLLSGLSLKLDILIPGNNIQINDSVISATDTIPNDGILTLVFENEVIGTFSANQGNNVSIEIPGLTLIFATDAEVIALFDNVARYDYAVFDGAMYVEGAMYGFSTYNNDIYS